MNHANDNDKKPSLRIPVATPIEDAMRRLTLFYDANLVERRNKVEDELRRDGLDDDDIDDAMQEWIRDAGERRAENLQFALTLLLSAQRGEALDDERTLQ